MRRYHDDMADRYSPSVRRRRLGLAMRGYREAAGLTAEAAAEVLGVAVSTLSKLETADRNLTKPVLLLMFEKYGVPDTDRKDLLDMHGQSRERGWWQDLSVQPGAYVDFEAEAIQVQSFDALLVPGLLQTEAYAGAITTATQSDVADEHKLRQWKQVRVKRAELLTDPDGPIVWAVVHEAALRTVVGGSQTMVAQLRHIADLAEQVPRLEVQVLPFAAGEYSAMESGFSILTFEDLPTLGYTESITSRVWVEKQKDINRLVHAFGKLISQSQPTRDSVEWLRDQAERMERAC